MKYVLAPLAALALAAAAAGLPRSGSAAPFEAKNVAADAKWVVHIDVDAIRDSHLVQKAFSTCPMLKNSDAHFDMIRDKIGIDLRKDLHGITLYGPDADKKHAVAIVFSAADKKLLLEKAEKAADHKVTKRGDVEIHSWTMKHGAKSEPAAGAFYKDDAMVFAADAKRVGAAIDVLDGKSPGIDDPKSPLGGHIYKGSTVIVRASEIPANNHCALLKEASSFRVAMGENEGKSFYRARLTMKTPEAAEQIATVTEGFKAMGQLRFSGEADVLKLVDGIKSTVHGHTVSVRWDAPADDVWNVAEKLGKKAAEHFKKTGDCPFAGKAKAAKAKKDGDKK